MVPNAWSVSARFWISSGLMSSETLQKMTRLLTENLSRWRLTVCWSHRSAGRRRIYANGALTLMVNLVIDGVTSMQHKDSGVSLSVSSRSGTMCQTPSKTYKILNTTQPPPEADLGMFSMFGRTGAPTKRGPPQARDCRTPARHVLICGVGPIYAVFRHLKLKSSRGAELHSLARGLWFGGSVYRNVRKFMWGWAPTFLPNKARSGLNPALAIASLWPHIYSASSWSQHTLKPSSSLKVTHRSFRHASPHLWNQLPTSLRIPHPNYSSPSQRSFPGNLIFHLSLFVCRTDLVALDRSPHLFAHRFYVLVLFFSVLVIPKCGRLSWPALWSTFGRM